MSRKKGSKNKQKTEEAQIPERPKVEDVKQEGLPIPPEPKKDAPMGQLRVSCGDGNFYNIKEAFPCDGKLTNDILCNRQVLEAVGGVFVRTMWVVSFMVTQ